ncbi:hypothetical protein D3C77_575740 [compost metagenome]
MPTSFAASVTVRFRGFRIFSRTQYPGCKGVDSFCILWARLNVMCKATRYGANKAFAMVETNIACIHRFDGVSAVALNHLRFAGHFG